MEDGSLGGMVDSMGRSGDLRPGHCTTACCRPSLSPSLVALNGDRQLKVFSTLHETYLLLVVPGDLVRGCGSYSSIDRR